MHSNKILFFEKKMFCFLFIFTSLTIFSVEMNFENTKREIMDNMATDILKDYDSKVLKATYECPPKHTKNLHDLSEGVYLFTNYQQIYGCNQNLVHITIYKCLLFVFSCRFTSIHSRTGAGGAINLEITEDSRILDRTSRIENCHFIDCSETSGGAIYIAAFKLSYFKFIIINNL